MDIHGEMKLVTDDLLIFSSKFVGTVYTLGMPICPVQAIFKYSDSKWMWKACSKNPVKADEKVMVTLYCFYL